MVNLSDPESVRLGLVQLCRDPRRRVNPPNIDVTRHNWRPYSVVDPASLSRFTDAGAWELIADWLQEGCSIRCQPPSSEFQDHAYVIIEPLGSQRLYIKFAIFPKIAKVIGISFHYERTI